MSLSDLANIVEIVGIFAILFGVAFGLIQLKQHRIQRRELALIECARSFEDEGFTEAYRLISELPAGMTKAEFDKLGDKYESAAIRVGMKFETMGLLVHRGMVSMARRAFGRTRQVGAAACVPHRNWLERAKNLVLL